jgi:hypothetical protein
LLPRVSFRELVFRELKPKSSGGATVKQTSESLTGAKRLRHIKADELLALTFALNQ